MREEERCLGLRFGSTYWVVSIRADDLELQMHGTCIKTASAYLQAGVLRHKEDQQLINRLGSLAGEDSCNNTVNVIACACRIGCML